MVQSEVTIEPLRTLVDPGLLDRAIDLLVRALKPTVEFQEDVDAIRRAASDESRSRTVEALRVLYSDIPGLRVREDVEALLEGHEP